MPLVLSPSLQSTVPVSENEVTKQHQKRLTALSVALKYGLGNQWWSCAGSIGTRLSSGAADMIGDLVARDGQILAQFCTRALVEYLMVSYRLCWGTMSKAECKEAASYPTFRHSKLLYPRFCTEWRLSIPPNGNNWAGGF